MSSAQLKITPTITQTKSAFANSSNLDSTHVSRVSFHLNSVLFSSTHSYEARRTATLTQFSNFIFPLEKKGVSR